jgi:hypothetical protein
MSPIVSGTIIFFLSFNYMFPFAGYGIAFIYALIFGVIYFFVQNQYNKEDKEECKKGKKV